MFRWFALLVFTCFSIILPHATQSQVPPELRSQCDTLAGRQLLFDKLKPSLLNDAITQRDLIAQQQGQNQQPGAAFVSVDDIIRQQISHGCGFELLDGGEKEILHSWNFDWKTIQTWKIPGEFECKVSWDQKCTSKVTFRSTPDASKPDLQICRVHFTTLVKKENAEVTFTATDFVPDEPGAKNRFRTFEMFLEADGSGSPTNRWGSTIRVSEIEFELIWAGWSDDVRRKWGCQFVNKPAGASTISIPSDQNRTAVVYSADALGKKCTTTPLYYVQGTRVFAADVNTGAPTTRVLRHIVSGIVYAADANNGSQTNSVLRYIEDGRVYAADAFTGTKTSKVINKIINNKVFEVDAQTANATDIFLRCISGNAITD